VTLPKWPGSEATEYTGIGPNELALRRDAELVDGSRGIDPFEHTVTIVELESILSSILPRRR